MTKGQKIYFTDYSLTANGCVVVTHFWKWLDERTKEYIVTDTRLIIPTKQVYTDENEALEACGDRSTWATTMIYKGKME